MCLQELLGEGAATLSTLHGSLTWLCQTCTPSFRMMTVMGPGGSQSRPVNRRQATVSSAVPLPAAAPIPTPVQAVEDIAERLAAMHMSQGETVNTNPNNAAQVEETPSGQRVSGPPAQGQDCDLFYRGDCPYGISGRRGGVCTAVHRKRCSQFLRWGSKGNKGCRGDYCNNLHPLVCPASLDLLCTNQSCGYKIHVQKCRRKARPPSDSDSPRQSPATGQTQRKPSDRPSSGQSGNGRKLKPRSGNSGGVKACKTCGDSDVADKATNSRDQAGTAKACAACSNKCCQHPSDKAVHLNSVNTKGMRYDDGSCGVSSFPESHCPHSEPTMGFQVPTVQPMLEAWLEGVKKEMSQKQELMFQMMRMEMMQARQPSLGRGAYGLHASF